MLKSVDFQSPYLLWPSGLALANVVVAVLAASFTSVSVALRLYVRVSEKVFGWDDAGVGFGAVVFAAQAAVAVYGNLAGVSRPDSELNAWRQEQGSKFYIIFLMIYVVVLVSLKTSICVTVYRIAVERRHRLAVWVLLVFNWISFLVLMLGVNLYCRPLAAMWDAQLIATGKGYCSPVSVLVDIGEVATSVTIASDFALALLPALILRKAMMDTKAKWQVFGLLSFASLASIVTIIRIPFMLRYLQGTDLLVWGGYVELCALTEVCIGMVSSCVPSLRRLTGRVTGPNGSGGQPNARGVGRSFGSLITFGRLPVKDRRRLDLGDEQMGVNLTIVQVRAKHQEDTSWQRLQDSSSERGLFADGPGCGGIHTERTYAVHTQSH